MQLVEPQESRSPLTVGRLLEALKGLDPAAPVVIGIINGERFDAADAFAKDCGGSAAGFILCYEEARPWDSLPAGVTARMPHSP